MRRSKEDAEHTRQAILDAAEELFCSQGVAASTLEKISRRAGVTRGALYWHFKDKGDVLEALHNRSRPVQVALIETAAEKGHEDPLGFLESAGIEMLATFEKDDRQQRMFLIMNAHSPDEEGAAWVQRVNGDLFRTLTSLIRQAQANGALSPEFSPEEAGVITLATMHGLLHEWLRSGKSFPLASLGAKLMVRQVAMLRHGAPNPRSAPG